MNQTMDILLVKILEEPISRDIVLGVLVWVSFWVAYRVGRWAEAFSRPSKKIDTADKQRKSQSQNMAHILARLDLIYVNTLSEQIVSARKNTWDEFFLNGPMVSKDFMCDRLRHQGGRRLNGGR